MYDKNTAREVIDLESDQVESQPCSRNRLINTGEFLRFEFDNYQFSKLPHSTGQSKRPNYSNMIDLVSSTDPDKDNIEKVMRIVDRTKSDQSKTAAPHKPQIEQNGDQVFRDSNAGFHKPQEERKKESVVTNMSKSYSFPNKLQNTSSVHSEPVNSMRALYDQREKSLSRISEPTSLVRNSSPAVNVKKLFAPPLKESIPYPMLEVHFPKPKRVLPETMYKLSNFNAKKSEDENSALESLRQWKNKNLQADERVEEIPTKRPKPEEFSDLKAELPQKKLQTTQQLINNIIQEQHKRTQEKIIDAKEEAQKREIAEKKYRESLWSSTSQISKLSEARLKEHQRKQRFQLRNDMSDFYRFILNLKLFELEDTAEDLNPIPIAFDDGQDYINSFKPVFLEELKGDISSAARQINFSRASLTSLRLYTKKDSTVFISPERDFDTSRPAFQFSFKPDDLVLLLLYEEGALPSSYSSATKPTIPYLLGICEYDIRNDKKISHQLMIKISPEYEHLFSSNNANYYYIVYTETLTTLIREYRMIALAEFIDLAEFILLPRMNSQADDLQVPREFWDTIGRMYNESQFRAILDICSKFRGISLLQGPPGTGKTQTVMGVLSAFLLSKGLTTYKPHVLVCAPSNSAVDELAYRVVKQGLIDSKGVKRNDLSYVRVGHWNQDHVELKQRNPNDRKEPPKDVKSISLSELVSNRIRGEGLSDTSVLIHEIKKELNKVDKALAIAKNKSDSLIIQDLINTRQSLQNNLFRYKHEKLHTEDKKRHFQQEILNKADVVFCTLSGAGSREISQIIHKFDYVIIDEACQCVELSSLIPLQYGAQIVVMVGDPQQLPSTTFSMKSKRAGYDISLFERLMKGGCPLFMLEIQYRMSLEIREFPSYYFYNNRLLDADTILTRSKPTWIPNLPCWFFNYLGSRESRTQDETSISNYPEAALIVEIYEKLRPIHGTKLDIGVITPYKKQVRLIRNLLDEKFKSTYRNDIEVNTVDGFQGREKNLIIFSCVRAQESVGFLADRRRMNVAITRARYSIWIIGKTDTLVRNRDWREYVKYMKSREWYSDVKDIKDVVKVFQNSRDRMDVDKRYQPVPQFVERKRNEDDEMRNQTMQDLKDPIQENCKEGLKELVRHHKTQEIQLISGGSKIQEIQNEIQTKYIVNSMHKSQDSARIHQKPYSKTSQVSVKSHSKTPQDSVKSVSKTSQDSVKPYSKTAQDSVKPHEESKKVSGKFQPIIPPQKPRVKKQERFDAFEFIKSLNK